MHRKLQGGSDASAHAAADTADAGAHAATDTADAAAHTAPVLRLQHHDMAVLRMQNPDGPARLGGLGDETRAA